MTQNFSDNPKENKYYEEMLREQGFEIPVYEEKEELRKTCCGLSFYEMQIHNGFYVCHKCNIPFAHDYSYFFNEYSKPYEAFGSNSSHSYIKKREYKHVNHFIEVLRRYMGVSKLSIPEQVLELVEKNINVLNKNSYFNIRELLREFGYQKYYHEIFPIIYKLKGVQVFIDNKDYWKCINLFKMFKYKYLKMEAYKEYGKTSIPSYYMILKSFLKRIDHECYYILPELKNNLLRENVNGIIEKLEIKDYFELLKCGLIL